MRGGSTGLSAQPRLGRQAAPRPPSPQKPPPQTCRGAREGRLRLTAAEYLEEREKRRPTASVAEAARPGPAAAAAAPPSGPPPGHERGPPGPGGGRPARRGCSPGGLGLPPYPGVGAPVRQRAPGRSAPAGLGRSASEEAAEAVMTARPPLSPGTGRKGQAGLLLPLPPFSLSL